MIYNLLSFFVLILASPFLALLSFKSKFKRSIPARFFLKKNQIFPQKEYHFHACSLGEAVSIEPFVRAFDSTRVSVTTDTGFAKASQFAKEVRFLPFECFLPFWLSPCRVLVVFESELWLNLFKYAKKNNSRTVLLNARISDKSYKKYLRFKLYYRWIFSYIDIVLAQSKVDKERLEKIGAKNVFVVGNVKSTNSIKPSKTYLKSKNRIIVIASSHQKEEERLLANIILKPNDQLFVVPRHPERFGEVDVLLSKFSKKNNFSYEKFSDKNRSDNSIFESKVILVDAMSELINIYAISDIAIICGSFEDNIGGHNPIEAAKFNCKIISGKFIHNQKQLFESISGVKFCDYEDIDFAINDKDLKPAMMLNACDFSNIIKFIKGEDENGKGV